MTNAEIIMRESIALVEQGILATKTEKMVDTNGEIVEMEVPEDIHTFDEWKRQGRIVKYGEHNIAKFAIWSPTKKSQKMLAESDKELTDKEKKQLRMYLRTACWFKYSQTQTVEEAEAERKARKAEKAKAKEEPKEPEEPKKSEQTAKPEKSTTATEKKTGPEDYKRMISALHKATLKKNMGKRYLLVARSGKSVYLSDSGWWIKKITLTEYNKYFEGAKEYYRALKDGEGVRIDNGGSVMNAPTLPKTLDDLFKSEFKDAHQTKCTVTDYTEEIDEKSVRAVMCGNVCIGVNEDFLRALPNEKWFANAENPLGPIVSNTAAVLPIRTGKDFAERALEHINAK